MKARCSLTLLVLFGSCMTHCDKKASDSSKQPQAASLSSKAKAPAASAPIAGSASAAAPKRPEKPLNVMLLSIDSLRADMPWAGYDRPIAPNLTELAKQSVVYEKARSVSSYTAQSVATMLSGRYASTLYRDGYFFTGYSKANQFFPEALQKAGVFTAAVHGHMYFHRGKHLNQGFDVWEIAPGVTFDSETDNNITSEKMTQVIIEQLKKKRPGQFFLWAHYMDPHDQYILHDMCPEEWGRKNRDRYDCEVLYTDHFIGKLLNFVKQQDYWNDTAVIITADHGEAFGDHGMYKHAFELWEVLVRVPLMFKVPGAAPKRISEPRTHIDLAPTIMDLMGQPPLPTFQGQSLVPEIFGEPPKARDLIVLQLNEDTHNPPRRAIVKGDYKLIVWGKNQGYKRQLFNLKEDPGELSDLSESEPERLKEMRALFKQAFDAMGSIKPYGGMKLRAGTIANGPSGPTSGSASGAGQ